jgi:hypothetical protein
VASSRCSHRHLLRHSLAPPQLEVLASNRRPLARNTKSFVNLLTRGANAREICTADAVGGDGDRIADLVSARWRRDGGRVAARNTFGGAAAMRGARAMAPASARTGDAQRTHARLEVDDRYRAGRRPLSCRSTKALAAVGGGCGGEKTALSSVFFLQ